MDKDKLIGTIMLKACMLQWTLVGKSSEPGGRNFLKQVRKTQKYRSKRVMSGGPHFHVLASVQPSYEIQNSMYVK